MNREIAEGVFQIIGGVSFMCIGYVIRSIGDKTDNRHVVSETSYLAGAFAGCGGMVVGTGLINTVAAMMADKA